AAEAGEREVDRIVPAVAVDDVVERVAGAAVRARALWADGQVLEVRPERPGAAREDGVASAGVGEDCVAWADVVIVVAQAAVERVDAGTGVERVVGGAAAPGVVGRIAAARGVAGVAGN